MFVSQVFEMVTDVRHLKVGDILEEAPNYAYAQKRSETVFRDEGLPISGLGAVQQAWQPAILLAQARPVHKFIGVRMELLVQIRRPTYATIDWRRWIPAAGRERGEGTRPGAWVRHVLLG